MIWSLWPGSSCVGYPPDFNSAAELIRTGATDRRAAPIAESQRGHRPNLRHQWRRLQRDVYKAPRGEAPEDGELQRLGVQIQVA